MVNHQKKKIRVGVIFGGRSGEHEVSIVSAQSVMAALDKEKYEVVPIGITKQGRWVASPKAIDVLKESAQRLPAVSFLPADPNERRLVTLPRSATGLLKESAPGAKQLDVVFPVLHGRYGEDGTIQGMLELADLPYVGAGVLGSALGLDKVVQKQLFEQAGLPIVKYVWFSSAEWHTSAGQLVRTIEAKLKYPMFTKPANTGSSVGVSKAHNRKQLTDGIGEAARYDRKVIVEQGIGSIREIELAVLGNADPKVSVPGEVVASNEFYDYDAKYVDGKSQSYIPADLPGAVTKKLQEYARKAFLSLDLSGMARVDFFVGKKDQAIFLNEVNTIPGFTSISMYPKLWEASGLSYPDLLDRLIGLALERHAEAQQYATSYAPKRAWHKDSA